MDQLGNRHHLFTISYETSVISPLKSHLKIYTFTILTDISNYNNYRLTIAVDRYICLRCPFQNPLFYQLSRKRLREVAKLFHLTLLYPILHRVREAKGDASCGPSPIIEQPQFDPFSALYGSLFSFEVDWHCIPVIIILRVESYLVPTYEILQINDSKHQSEN